MSDVKIIPLSWEYKENWDKIFKKEVIQVAKKGGGTKGGKGGKSGCK